MDTENEEFLKRLRATFRIEAAEHVRAISSGLMELEKTLPPDLRAQVIETIFREAHSLKGAARSVSLPAVESICQPVESIFAALKRQELTPDPAFYEALHQAIDTIAQLVAGTGEESSPPDQSRIRELNRKLLAMSRKTAPQDNQEKPATAAGGNSSTPPAAGMQAEPRPQPEKSSMSAGTVRIPAAKLDPLLLQAEEMISAKMSVSRRAAELQELCGSLALWKTESARWKERLSGGPEWDELLEWNETRLNTLIHEAAAVTKAVEQDQRALRRMVDDHLDGMKGILMFPVSSLVESFPRLVRDLAREQGKEAELVIRGDGVEIDKRVLEELKDPLIHLLRNSVDHGIKPPAERALRNKPPRAIITLTFAANENRQLEISVSDDGAGVDADLVREAAVKAGLVSQNAAEKMSRHELGALIFQSGISTSPFITNISGRGLGLAIVREKVEKLGGAVSMETQAHAGATFRLLVPMTLATFRGVLVQAEGQVFVLPSGNVARVLRVSREEIKTVENRETILLDGQVLAAVGLGRALGLPVLRGNSAVVDSHIPVVVVALAGQRIAFLVDEVLDEQQVLVKSLGRQLGRVRNLAGATVLGTGKVAPVLNVSDLLKSAVRAAAAALSATGEEEAKAGKGRILVADDSITSRTLLKNILETAGYLVKTAVDGMDAATQVRSEEFDLVVSDVDMPRLSGFELTAKIRGDKKIAGLPVVLVTALESREDRERGIDAGANAYIVKSSFDQSNLLEIVRRLL
ncbi:MAG: response regulator [Elusimicrobiota bacterium]|nr:response regulator [Elusimicrobiota bacterium]